MNKKVNSILLLIKNCQKIVFELLLKQIFNQHFLSVIYNKTKKINLSMTTYLCHPRSRIH